MMKAVLMMGVAAMLAPVRAQDSCADPLSQDTMIQVLALVTNVNARLDAMEATVNALADSGGRLDALEGSVSDLQAGLADGQANFQALQGLLYDGALMGEEGHEAIIMNGHVYRNEASGAEVTTSSCYSPERCGAQLTDGSFYFNVGGLDWLVNAASAAGATAVINVGEAKVLQAARIFNQNEYAAPGGDPANREVAHIYLRGAASPDGPWTDLVGMEGGVPLDETDGGNAREWSSNSGTFFHMNGGGNPYQYYQVELIDFFQTTSHYGLMEVQLFSLDAYDGTGGAYVDPTALADADLINMDRVGASCRDATATGPYLINYGVGDIDVYCDMDRAGGGWTLLMKAAHGGTFGWDSDHWRSTTLLNEGDISTTNGDAKYEPFNSMPVSAFLAVWPEIDGGHEWFIGEGTHMTIDPVEALQFFQNHRVLSDNHNPDTWNGWRNDVWSWQDGHRRYAVSESCNHHNHHVRWGYSWNNEGGCDSNDASGGIGMKQHGWSAGDAFGCCGHQRWNRQMQVQIYGR